MPQSYASKKPLYAVMHRQDEPHMQEDMNEHLRSESPQTPSCGRKPILWRRLEYLEICNHVCQGGGASEGQHNALAVPSKQHFGVQALLPEQFVLVQWRVEQAAALLDRQVGVLNLHTTACEFQLIHQQPALA